VAASASGGRRCSPAAAAGSRPWRSRAARAASPGTASSLCTADDRRVGDAAAARARTPGRAGPAPGSRSPVARLGLAEGVDELLAALEAEQRRELLDVDAALLRAAKMPAASASPPRRRTSRRTPLRLSLSGCTVRLSSSRVGEALEPRAVRVDELAALQVAHRAVDGLLVQLGRHLGRRSAVRASPPRAARARRRAAPSSDSAESRASGERLAVRRAPPATWPR
jgi:hypothetical protein